MRNLFENNPFSLMPVYFKVLAGISILFLSYALSGLLGIWVASISTGLSLKVFQNMNFNDASEKFIYGLKIIQIFVDVGLFLIPSLLIPIVLFNMNPVSFMGMNKRSGITLFIIAILLALCVQPIVDISARMNQEMRFPDSLKSLESLMKGLETKNENLMQRFLNMKSGWDILLNIFLIAIMPAVLEEFFFRGFLQKSLQLWIRNGHAAVIITAFVFSFIHMEFYGFLPRFILGLLLGYAYLWSGDIKLPILIHFTNNFLDLGLSWYLQQQGKTPAPDASDTGLPAYQYIVAVVIFALLIYLFKSRTNLTTVTIHEGDQNA
jgi:uncharacterized protein